MLIRYENTPFDRVWNDVMGATLGTSTSPRTFNPAIDVRTTEDEVVFVCDVPGVRQEDLDISLENHVLTIKGSRKFESSSKEQVMLGRSYGAFSRSYTLPDYVDDTNLTANLADGILTIRIPKQPKAKPRKIQVTASNTKQLNE